MSTGNCVAVGFYTTNTASITQAFIDTESHGMWAAHAFAPRLPANAGAASDANLSAVTCLKVARWSGSAPEFWTRRQAE